MGGLLFDPFLPVYQVVRIAFLSGRQPISFRKTRIILIIKQPSPFRSCVHRMHVLADRNYGKHFCSNA